MNWSLEHIHAPRRAEGLQLEKEVALIARRAREGGAILPRLTTTPRPEGRSPYRRSPARREDVNKDLFTRLSARVTEMFNQLDAYKDVQPHRRVSALLPSSANSALGDSVFEVKRPRSFAMDRDGE